VRLYVNIQKAKVQKHFVQVRFSLYGPNIRNASGSHRPIPIICTLLFVIIDSINE
jgi:hypothetical protein